MKVVRMAPTYALGVGGFTLFELVVVLAVVAVLALTALPSYSAATAKARRTEGKVLLQTVMAAEERYYITFNRYTADAGVAGLGATLTSQPGSYYRLGQLNLSADGQSVTAIAEPQGAQADDVCGSLGLDSTGRRTAMRQEGCW